MKHLKKTLCLLLAVMMLLALGVPAMATGEVPVDAAHFPDQALRTYVTDYCDTNKDNKLSAAECEAVQCIDLFEMKITKVADMTGIEHFTNLHELIACGNQITALDLSGMTKLEKLDVSGCGKLQSLKLAGCSALTQLDASSCALTVLDLTGCSALRSVACSYNALTALDVSAAEKLTTLECSANRLTALDLSGHKELKVLTCSLNALTKLDLTGCTALESLDCSDNALAALAAAQALGIPIEDAAQALSLCQGVRGRAEVVPTDTDYTVLIDYAHTPDGLKNILSTVCGFADARVLVVFGCGGDRDRTKRAEMGRIAARLADEVIVTSDNPRTENPYAILHEILAGMADSATPFAVLESRCEAIAYALDHARTGDVVVLAGKGHETYQVVGAETLPLDERQVVREHLSQ